MLVEPATKPFSWYGSTYTVGYGSMHVGIEQARVARSGAAHISEQAGSATCLDARRTRDVPTQRMSASTVSERSEAVAAILTMTTVPRCSTHLMVWHGRAVQAHRHLEARGRRARP
jgi:hypothetical protein